MSSLTWALQPHVTSRSSLSPTLPALWPLWPALAHSTPSRLSPQTCSSSSLGPKFPDDPTVMTTLPCLQDTQTLLFLTTLTGILVHSLYLIYNLFIGIGSSQVAQW